MLCRWPALTQVFRRHTRWDKRRRVRSRSCRMTSAEHASFFRSCTTGPSCVRQVLADTSTMLLTRAALCRLVNTCNVIDVEVALAGAAVLRVHTLERRPPHKLVCLLACGHCLKLWPSARMADVRRHTGVCRCLFTADLLTQDGTCARQPQALYACTHRHQQQLS